MSEEEQLSICPICGDKNECVMVSGAPEGTPCWCYDATISPQVVAKIPEEKRGLVCICPRCAGDAQT